MKLIVKIISVNLSDPLEIFPGPKVSDDYNRTRSLRPIRNPFLHRCIYLLAQEASEEKVHECCILGKDDLQFTFLKPTGLATGPLSQKIVK